MSEKTKFSASKLGAIIFLAVMAFSLMLIVIYAHLDEVKTTYYYITLVFFVVFLILSIIGLIRLSIEAKSYREFLKSGKLIKDLPFVKHTYIEKIKEEKTINSFIAVVDYKTKDGKTISIGSEYGLDIEKYGDRKTVDLYIDENNLKNYIIDFDLEEKIKNNELL